MPASFHMCVPHVSTAKFSTYEFPHHSRPVTDHGAGRSSRKNVPGGGDIFPADGADLMVQGYNSARPIPQPSV